MTESTAILKALGERVAQERQAKGLSSRELAALCDGEVSHYTVLRVERGEGGALFANVYRLLSALGIDPALAIAAAQEETPAGHNSDPSADSTTNADLFRRIDS